MPVLPQISLQRLQRLRRPAVGAPAGAPLLTAAALVAALLALPLPGEAATAPGAAPAPAAESAELARALRALEADDVDAAERLVREALAAAPQSAAAHEILGVIEARRGEPLLALRALERAVDLDPAQSSALTKMGDIHAALGDAGRAGALYRQALVRNPGDRHANQRLGLAFAREGRSLEAILHLERGIRGTPAGYLGVKLDLAMLHGAAGNFARSTELLAPFAAAPGASPAVLGAYGEARLGAGDPAAAAAAFGRALAAAPEDVSALAGLGRAQRAAGEPAAAARTLAEAARHAPDDMAVVRELAGAQLAAGDAAAAFATAQAAAEAGAGAEAMLLLGALHAAAGDAASAEAVFRGLLGDPAAGPAAHAELGALQQRGGDLAAAEATFRAFAAAHPELAEAHFRLGSHLGLTTRYAEAAEVYRRGLAIDAAHRPTLRGLAVALVQAGRPDEAADHGAILAALPGAGPDDLFLAGSLMEDAGRPEAAEALYRRVLAAAPDHWAALNNLASLLTARGEAEAALAPARRAQALAPDHAATNHTLGRTLLAAGEVEAAVDPISRAVALQPENVRFRRSLSDALAAAGRPEEARAEANAARALETR